MASLHGPHWLACRANPCHWHRWHQAPPVEANRSQGIQNESSRALCSSPISAEDSCPWLSRRQSSERWLTCLTGLSQKRLTWCFTFGAKEARLYFAAEVAGSWNECLPVSDGFPGGWLGKLPRGDEMVMIRCTRRAAELPTRCSVQNFLLSPLINTVFLSLTVTPKLAVPRWLPPSSGWIKAPGLFIGRIWLRIQSMGPQRVRHDWMTELNWMSELDYNNGLEIWRTGWSE